MNSDKMEFKTVKQYLPLLHSLNKCRGNCERNILLSHMDDNAFRFICGQIDKSIQNPDFLKLSPTRLKKLRKSLEHDKKRIKYLTSAKGNTQRKQKIVRQSGQGLGLLVGILAPVLIELVRGLVTKKKAK